MRCLIVALLAAGLASAGLSAPFSFVLNTNMTIEKVNIPTNNSIPAGTTTFLSNSLALTPSGSLLSADSFGNLWNVTGPPIPAGPTGRTQIGDLDYANNGLWGFSNASSELFFFDLGLSSVTYAQTISLPGPGTVTGVAHHAATGDIYLSANNGLNSDFLLKVPSFANSASLIGSMTHSDAFSFISDIDFDGGGALYAMTWFHRHFYTVNPLTGQTAFVSAGPHRDTTGMALNPVPEPASMAMVALGLLALRRRPRILR